MHRERFRAGVGEVLYSALPGLEHQHPAAGSSRRRT
jgi:hypothetical protein